MSVLPIHLYGSAVLRAKAHSVTNVDDALVKLVFDMFETMHTSNGIGLAANQVGSLNRVIVVDIADAENRPEEGDMAVARRTSPHLPRSLVLINPEIIQETGLWTMEEGCLSIPEVRGDVERAERVRVRFRDANLKEQELEMDGLLARVSLHEIDHLNGTLFIDRLTAQQRKPLRSRLGAIKKGEVETSYPVISAVEV